MRMNTNETPYDTAAPGPGGHGAPAPGAEPAADPDLPREMTMPPWLERQHRPPYRGYRAALGASCGHALQTLLRRRRLALAALVAFLPVLIPIALCMLPAVMVISIGPIAMQMMKAFE